MCLLLLLFKLSPTYGMRMSDWSSDVCSSDLGIPLLFTHDVIHGHRTIFPLPLGLACAWDPDLVRRTARVAAMEAAAEGITLAWAPMLDVARDARWGRCAESPGEAPLPCAAFRTAMTQGSPAADLAGPDAGMAHPPPLP